MIIALATQSQVKLDATVSALSLLGLSVELVAVKAVSHVDEQPFGDGTRQGAMNRALHAASLVSADVIIAVESGIFQRNHRYFDVAVVLAYMPAMGGFVEVESERVEFPCDAVMETIRRGVDRWTVGKVLEEMGVVTQHDDPHVTLTGRSRSLYIRDALVALFCKLQDAGLISVSRLPVK